MSESIPNGWKLYPLATFLKEVKAKNKSNENYPVLSVTKYHGFVRSDSYFKKQVFSRDLTTYRIVSEGQFAYATIHLDEGSLGLLEGVDKGLVSPMYTVFETTNAIDNVFLFYLLKSDLFMNIYPSLGQGSIDRRASIPFKVLSAVPFLSPPLPEQQKIAAILTSVDEVIENTQAQINKLKDLKTGMMQELLTRGVGVDGKPHTEFKDSPVGRIPKGWDVLPLSSLAITKGLQTGPFGGQLHADEYTEKGIPVIMPKNMKSNNVCIQNIARISEDKAIELSKHRVMEGDIVFSRRGDIGRFVLINKKNEGWLCGTGSLRARLDRTTILPLYLSSYLTLDLVIEWLNNNAVGQTMLNLNTSILGELPVVLPPIYEQELIANSIESIDKRLGILGRKLSQIQKSKKALMQDLLTGKVRVKVDS